MRRKTERDLERFWMRHADQEIGDLYSKMEEEAEFCQTVTDSVGIGFQLPNETAFERRDVAPVAPKTVSEGSIAQVMICNAKKWSGRKDLNLRPPGPEPGALARLRYAPTDELRHIVPAQAGISD